MLGELEHSIIQVEVHSELLNYLGDAESEAGNLNRGSAFYGLANAAAAIYERLQADRDRISRCYEARKGGAS